MDRIEKLLLLFLTVALLVSVRAGAGAMGGGAALAASPTRSAGTDNDEIGPRVYEHLMGRPL